MVRYGCLLLPLVCLGLSSCTVSRPEGAMTLQEIRIRDPFILADKNTKTYYMYAQMGNLRNVTHRKRGVEAYTSKDLQYWYGPQPVFVMPDDFWGREAVWAPEVHKYNGRYYLFVTFTSDKPLPEVPNRPKNRLRGTSILVADSPAGPFLPFANKPHTPNAWMALDGTFWVEDGKPWMVFCHEWIQVTDGTMEAVRLADDLSQTIGNPITLFKASQAPWIRTPSDVDSQYQGNSWFGYVTDGPFLYRTKTGRLMMIWSSFGEEKYAVGLAWSESGGITGPWKQMDKPLFKANGGHAMLFKTFNNKLMLVLHQPNTSPMERAKLLELKDTGDRLVMK